MKHTKGPWKIVQGGDEECIYIEQANYDPNGRGAVATVFTVHAKPTEQELADAYLIASSPVMLEALRRAEMKLSAYVGVCKDDKELTNTVLPMVTAAIAKAGGAV